MIRILNSMNPEVKKMPKSKKPFVMERPCYTLAIVDGASAELTMYGEIVETQPTDWWGDPIDGQFIILSEFLKDLEEIKGCTELTIHMNSVGGDAYASISIHNRLRELVKDGMNITCVVDGVAMSGGSLIMCAADIVKVNPSSIIMIHDCWTYVWKSANSSDLRKLADSLDVINESQAEIYVRKTGKDAEEIRQMMTATSYMTGRKAVEKGFADELIEDADDADIEVSADHKTLYAFGRKMRVAAMGQLPEGIKTHVETVETVPETDGGDKITPDASGKTGGKEPMTFEEFRKENPEAAEAALAEAKASVSHEEAVAAERKRIADIDEIASLYDAETVRSAKYGENPCTAEQMAFRAAKEMAKQGKQFMTNLADDTAESKASAVPAASAPVAEQPKEMSSAEKVAAGRELAKSLHSEKKEEV